MHQNTSGLGACKRAHLASNDDVVTGGVHGHAGEAAAGQQLARERLLGQVVHTHVRLRGHEEKGLGRVEGDLHDSPAVLAEGVLRRALRQLVHQHCLREGAWVSRCITLLKQAAHSTEVLRKIW